MQHNARNASSVHKAIFWSLDTNHVVSSKLLLVQGIQLHTLINFRLHGLVRRGGYTPPAQFRPSVESIRISRLTENFVLSCFFVADRMLNVQKRFNARSAFCDLCI